MLSLLVLPGCSSSSSQEGRLTTPGAIEQKKNEQRIAQAQAEAQSAAAREVAQTKAQTAALSQEKVERAASVQKKQGVTKVAFLAPLSGKSAPLGQAMVNAAQLALFDIGSDGFELMPRDTAGTPAGATNAVREAKAAGAQLIIGPLFATEVAAVKPEIEQAGLNALTLSTDVSLAQPGVFVMGFAPVPQVERVISYASKQGLHRFAALIPAGPYGKLVGEALRASLAKEGGEAVFIGGPNDVSKIIAQKERIDALFLPFGGAELRKIAGQLASAGLTPGQIKILGTGLWDEPNVAQGQALLVGGLYAAVEPEARQRFEEAYQSTYSKEAPRLATLAYDATALAAVLVRNGLAIDQTGLTNPAGFAGLDGVFRLKSDGQIERNLAISELTADGSRIVEAAPTSFIGR